MQYREKRWHSVMIWFSKQGIKWSIDKKNENISHTLLPVVLSLLKALISTVHFDDHSIGRSGRTNKKSFERAYTTYESASTENLLSMFHSVCSHHLIKNLLNFDWTYNSNECIYAALKKPIDHRFKMVSLFLSGGWTTLRTILWHDCALFIYNMHSIVLSTSCICLF